MSVVNTDTVSSICPRMCSLDVGLVSIDVEKDLWFQSHQQERCAHFLCKEFLSPYTFCVRRMEGVRRNGSLGSVDTGTSGLALIKAVTSAMKVVSIS